MIIVDTSVWIDVLNEVEMPAASVCIDLLRRGEPVGLTDVIFTEILQGLRTSAEAEMVERQLRSFPILQLQSLDDFAFAADLYRTARRKGVTIRKTLDCLIAAPCIQTGAALLHADQDFDLLASCTPLRIYTP
jgi:predicted nucleic acid-binding protein